MRLIHFCLFLGILFTAQIHLRAQERENEGIIKVHLVSRTVMAVTYRTKIGYTRIDFQGTPLLPNAKGEANVESKEVSVLIESEFERMEPASKFGPEYLTYVLWAITPEGHANNIGEVVLVGDRAKLNVTSTFQSFALVVTAEPYFAVSIPSEVVVLENIIRQDNIGKVEIVDAKTELLQYQDIHLDALKIDPKLPPEYSQARNAVRIAQRHQADKYAADLLAKAQRALSQADDYVRRKQSKKSIAVVSREAVQLAEDARVIALRRQLEEPLAKERKASASPP